MFHNQTAIDVLSPSGEPGQQARFREELDESSRKSHPGVQLVDVELLIAQHLASAANFIRFV